MLIGCNLLNIFNRNIIKLVIPKFWSAFLMSLTFENIVEFLKQHIKCVRYTALRKVYESLVAETVHLIDSDYTYG